MKLLLILLCLLLAGHVANSQAVPPDSAVIYAVVQKDCGSFGGYCIFYQDSTSEDFIEKMHLKQPKSYSDNARVLIALLKYMRKQGYTLLTSSAWMQKPTEPVISTEYIFEKKVWP